MNTDTSWIPTGVSLDKPHPARIYDYWLGGYHNFEVDRIMAERVVGFYPDVRLVAYANRAFLRRVVRFLIEQGIDQFLDIGSGLPTVGNVHEVAQSLNPAARIVYVDIDSVVVAHSLAMLENNPNATAIRADVHQIDQILSSPEVKNLLDWGKPLGVLLLAILQVVLDNEDAYAVVHTLRDALSPGSYVAITHVTYDDAPRETLEQIQALYARGGDPSKARSRVEVQQFFDGLELVEPGVVHTPLWRPEGPDDVFFDCSERALAWCGVGRKL